MSSSRRRLVQQAYSILDKDGSGIVDINDIKSKLIYYSKWMIYLAYK